MSSTPRTVSDCSHSSRFHSMVRLMSPPSSSEAIFLVNLGTALEKGDRFREIIAINQIVWDTFTHTLHVESDKLLTQHTRYALIATNRLRDTEGKRVRANDAFRRFR